MCLITHQKSSGPSAAPVLATLKPSNLMPSLSSSAFFFCTCMRQNTTYHSYDAQWLAEMDATIGQTVRLPTVRSATAMQLACNAQLHISTVGVCVPVTPMKPPMSSDAATMRWQGTSGAYGFRRSAYADG